jgi:hypothetical protein
VNALSPIARRSSEAHAPVVTTSPGRRVGASRVQVRTATSAARGSASPGDAATGSAITVIVGSGPSWQASA